MELFNSNGIARLLAFMPDRLTEIESWHRHMPFAYWLLSALKPEILVELGTHKGDSYCTLCQGVQQLQLETRCFAVDTWEGDSQAGFYGSEIYDDLRAYHDNRYASFSTLLKMTFDQALEQFGEGSIDLLHIDGLHTYEAVRHDFESWRPRLSDKAVVLFHDTSVREGDFAVWKLWEELRRDYRGYNFPFGFGLGVLQVGRHPDPAVAEFLDFAEEQPQLVASYFSRLADAIVLQCQSERLAATASDKEQLGQDLQFAREVVEQRDAQLEQVIGERDSLGNELTHAREIVAQRDESLQIKIAEVNELNQQRESLIAHQQSLEQMIAGQESQLKAQKNQVDRISGLYARQYAQLKILLESKTWRWRNRIVKLVGKKPVTLDSEISEVSSEPVLAADHEKVIDIIVPVYAGLEETRNCIESLLRSNYEAEAEVVVINDASPEPELVDYLQSIAEKVTLLHNETNKGFVATVNRGMKLHPGRDIVLLNSDTRVANDWLDRLYHCAYSGEKIGSVTPFSNNATICSYPNFCEDNELPGGFNEISLDRLFSEVNCGQSVTIPTAVGFCMYIRRDCLEDTGLFDEILFGRGYGEENEFCMRSAEAGWQHLLCADTFVYHAGGVSFADTQNEHQQAGRKALTSLYPGYDGKIQSFVERDSIAPFRFAIDLSAASLAGKPVVLMINHSRGGGTERHLNELAEQLSEKLTILLLHPYGAEGMAVKLTVFGGGADNQLVFDPLGDYEHLLEILKLAGVSRIHFHHTIGVHPRFWQLPEDLGVPFDLTVHDYYFVCPQITMTDREGHYCGEPDEQGCNRCLSARPAPGNGAIADWRRENSQLLYAAERIFVPSVDAEKRVQRYFPGLNTCYVAHDQGKIDWSAVTVKPLEKDQPLKVVVLGALSRFKGADLLESCALSARKECDPLEFHLIGYAYRKLKSYPMSTLHVSGAYEEEELEALIEKVDPHLVWFPGDCPETYSYTLSSCMKLGLPVLAPDLGAFPERLAGREWSWITEPGQSAIQINRQLIEIREKLISGERPRIISKGLANQSGNYDSEYPVSEKSAAVAINWPEFYVHLRALSVMRIEAIQSDKASMKSRIYGGLQWIRSRPILARLLDLAPVKWKIRAKRWLTGL